jgi:hypothetical protein
MFGKIFNWLKNNPWVLKLIGKKVAEKLNKAVADPEPKP